MVWETQAKWESWRESVASSRGFSLVALLCGNPVFKLTWLPLLSCPLLLLDHDGERKWRTAWVAGLMAFYWITEVLPIPVTAFLPLVLFPLLNIVPAKEVASAYINDTLFILVGSFIVALAMERWGLHTRVALRVVLLMGRSPRRLLAGFMGLTAFISMWINNTATASLMAPIALAVLNQISEQVTEAPGQGDVDVEGGHELHDMRPAHGGDDSTTPLATGLHDSVDTDASGNGHPARRQRTKRTKEGRYQTLRTLVGSGDDLPTSAPSGVDGDDIVVESVPVSQHSSSGSSDDADDDSRAVQEGHESHAVDQVAALPDADPDILSSSHGDEGFVADSAERKEYMALFVKGILLSLAYSASIGGTATLVGTAPNLVLINQFSAMFPLAPPISFFKWFMFAAPLAFVFLVVLWFYFCYFYCPRPDLITINLDMVRERYAGLGPISWPEVVVLIDFVVLVLLWLTRTGIHELSIKGWADLLSSDDYVSDGTVAMTCAVVLFLLPSRTEPGHKVMDWESTANLPWGIIMLMGGGFALAKGFVLSGLSAYLGKELEVLESLPVALLLLVICSSLTLLTELTSNVATANVVLPILGSIAVAINQSPLLLMIPGTISCSYAFMLPVATPPNAVIFAYDRFKVVDMVKAGLLVSAMGVVILVSASFVLAPFIFDIDFGELPAWAAPKE